MGKHTADAKERVHYFGRKLGSKENQPRPAETPIDYRYEESDSMRANAANVDLMLEELEQEIAKYIGTKYAIACSSARTAIRFSLLALDIGHGDEVVIPDFACQILPITVFCTGASPRFCDVTRQTCALSSTSLQEMLRPNTKAVIFVQLFGLPVDPSPIQEIVKKRGITLIDDAAQALGVSIGGKKAGSFGKVGILTFNKFLTVGLGGAATTDDEELAHKIKHIRNKYERKSRLASLGYYLMDSFGLKSEKIMRAVFFADNHLNQLVNITLAEKHFQETNGWVKANPNVLESWRSNTLTTEMIDQLMTYAGRYWHQRNLEKTEISALKDDFENLEEYLQDRRRTAKMYDEYLKRGGFERIHIPPNSTASYMRYPVLFSDKTKLSRCIEQLTQAGFTVDYRYKPLHRSPFFGPLNDGIKFSESVYIWEHILPLPIAVKMDSKTIQKVASIVNDNS